MCTSRVHYVFYMPYPHHHPNMWWVVPTAQYVIYFITFLLWHRKHNHQDNSCKKQKMIQALKCIIFTKCHVCIWHEFVACSLNHKCTAWCFLLEASTYAKRRHVWNWKTLDLLTFHCKHISVLCTLWSHTFWLNENRTDSFTILVSGSARVFSFISWTYMIDEQRHISSLFLILHLVFVGF